MTFLENTQIEIVSPRPCASTARAVLFDFDGTGSLIRSGWETVMIPMMVEILAALKTGESEAELTTCVNDFVLRLTGKQTIYQMIELADQVRRRGGTAREALEYKRIYHERLWDRIGSKDSGAVGSIPTPSACRECARRWPNCATAVCAFTWRAVPTRPS